MRLTLFAHPFYGQRILSRLNRHRQEFNCSLFCVLHGLHGLEQWDVLSGGCYYACSRMPKHSERNRDLSPSVARTARISPVTRERWAQIGITAQFLIVVRTLGEFFRLRHVLGTSFSAAVAAPYIGGALIAACFCWAGVTLYFFRRYTLSVWIALAGVVILLVYKIAVIGW